MSTQRSLIGIFILALVMHCRVVELTNSIHANNLNNGIKNQNYANHEVINVTLAVFFHVILAKQYKSFTNVFLYQVFVILIFYHYVIMF